MKNKRGQEIFGMSFGVIFSIFLIIVLLAVAFFAVEHFVGLSKCTNIGLFYDDLGEKVRDAWSSSSGKYEADFTSKIPKKGLFGTGIDYICFGPLNATPSDSNADEKQQSLINDYNFDPNGAFNVFAYPPDKGCDTGLGAINLKCGNANCINTNSPSLPLTPQFFCQPVSDDGSVTVRLVKRSQDYQISLRKV